MAVPFIAETNEQYMAVKTVSFDGSAGSGAVGNVVCFTVTGDVLVQVVSTCSEDLASAGGGSVSMGTVGNTGSLIAATTATQIDTGEAWISTTPSPSVGGIPGNRIIANGDNIVIAVTVAAVSDGTLTVYCLWRPLSVAQAWFRPNYIR